MNAVTNVCFHCGSPLRGSELTARVQSRAEPVCCAGCLAVAEMIDAQGLAAFYRYRSERIDKPGVTTSSDAYAREDVASRFVLRRGDRVSVHLLIDGLRCAACSWLIDRSLRKLSGVCNVNVNAATGRAEVEWTSGAVSLADVMQTIARLGFRPHPAEDALVARVQRDERRQALKRLAVSGFGMMQVMMFGVAVYSAEIYHEAMDVSLLHYFRLISLLVATPVLLYAGRPFLKNAIYSLRAKTIGLDVPVALALVLAFAASAWNTLRNEGEVYFDSVAMFIFFLTLGRFVEMSVRHRTTSVTDALSRQLPAIAHRMEGDEVVDVPTVWLRVGDVVLIRPGEVVPADAVIVDGATRLNESFLTGESKPVERGAGAQIIAGAINDEGSVRVRVTATGGKTVLSSIGALLQRAQSQKPVTAKTADVAAARFLRYILLGSMIVCGLWLAVDPSRAFSATLAVLIAACPCAFSIAMPATFAAATARLARLGMLVVRVDALESLTRVTRCVFDKTGTLTRGELQLIRCQTYSSLSERDALIIAATLERASEHAIARAFSTVQSNLHAEEVRIDCGRGVEGTVDGHRYRVGSPAYVAAMCNSTSPNIPIGILDTQFDTTVITLGDRHGLLATFELRDGARPGGAGVARKLHELGIESEIVSGDAPGAVARIAYDCSIGTFAARQTPESKVALVQRLQHSGNVVLMVGDGVNDAPVLSAAHVSIAMGRGAVLAQASADLVFIEDNLDALPSAISIARRALRIARQNLTWSAIYNFTALPLAALGYVPPWVAAIGMSLSSMAVVLNAARVLRPARNQAESESIRGASPESKARGDELLSGVPS